jgi:NAD(P)-dependent dehydrogenase (short-subunit alcohol dehydrogenase family)
MNMTANATAIVVGSPGALPQAVASLLAVRGFHVASVGFGGPARGAEARTYDCPRTSAGWRSLAEQVATAQGTPTVLVDVVGDPASYGAVDGSGRYVGAALSRVEDCLSAVRPALAGQRSGAVVLVGLPMGSEAAVGIPAADAVAGALAGMVRGLAVDLGDEGIRVNLVRPGLISLPGLDDRPHPGDGFGIVPLRRSGALGDAGLPSDVAEAVAFLVSDDAAYMTGSQLVVDGGLSQCKNTLAAAMWEDGRTDWWEYALDRR